jgi:hypothetical protein
MADCVIVWFLSIWFVSIWFFLSICHSAICHSVSFGFYGGAPGAGERSFVLYIKGVDRLGEKNKHFYFSSRVPNHCEYHLLSGKTHV